MTFEQLVEAAFPGHGSAVQRIVKCGCPDDLLEGCPKTHAWVAKCYHRPSRHALRMEMINEELEGFGVEAIFAEHDALSPDAEYINMGDTYSTTVLWDDIEGKFLVTTWGDWLEEAEKQGRSYP